MKIVKYQKLGQNVTVSFLYEDEIKTVNVVGDRSKAEILSDAYILGKQSTGEIYNNEEIIEEYILPGSLPNKMYVNWVTLTAEIYDQYADKMDIEPSFTVDGTDKVTIKDGKLVEDTVEEDTSYFIVAKCGELEERQRRIIHAPRKSVPSKEESLAAYMLDLDYRLSLHEMKGGETNDV